MARKKQYSRYHEVQRETIYDEDLPRPRKPMLAFCLSLCPGLGHHYAGFPVRGIVLFLSFLLISWLAAIPFMYIESRISMVLLSVPFVAVFLIGLDAHRLAHKQPHGYHLQWFNKVRLYALLFIPLVLFVNPLLDQIFGRHVVRAYFIVSDGMYPTLIKRDIVMANKLHFPERQQIALIEFGEEEETVQVRKTSDRQLVSRIIGLPGEMVEINSDGVFIDGKKLDEPYANYEKSIRTGTLIGENFRYGPQRVPYDSYFALSDNRFFSVDSRMLGHIKKHKIKGAITKIFWSWNLDKGNFQWDRTAKTLQ